MAGRPMAATRISPSRQTPAKSTVREWQMVTVECACSNSNAIGLPTMSLRPTNTARLPTTGIWYCRHSSMMPGGGVCLLPVGQSVDDRQQFLGGDGGGRRDALARDAQFRASLHFVAHVDLRSRVVPYQHDGESRRARGRRQRRHARTQVSQDLVADAVSIENCRHLSLMIARGAPHRNLAVLDVHP